METSKFKVQLITEDGKWPFVGNAYCNRNESVSIYLDEGVTITGGQKLYLSATEKRPEAAPAAEPAQ